MAKVFVSYSTRDEQRVADIVRLIEADDNDLQLFLSADRKKLQSGSFWNEMIMRSLDGADLILSFVSHHSVQAPWVNFELGYALARRIPRVIVVLDDIAVTDIHTPFRSLQLVSVSQDNASAAVEIVGHIRDYIPRYDAKNEPFLIQIGRERRPLSEGWVQYAGSPANTVRSRSGIQFGESADFGFRLPGTGDHLSAPCRYLVIGLVGSSQFHVYLSLELEDGRQVKFYVSTEHKGEGYVSHPVSEYCMPLRLPQAVQFVKYDLASFNRTLGVVKYATGFRVRGPTELSFIGVFAADDDIPEHVASSCKIIRAF